jgi:hypothetical protein
MLQPCSGLCRFAFEPLTDSPSTRPGAAQGAILSPMAWYFLSRAFTYCELFSRGSIPCVAVGACSGMMGGSHGERERSISK